MYVSRWRMLCAIVKSRLSMQRKMRANPECGVNAAVNASGLFIVTHKTHLIRSMRAGDDTGRVYRQRVSCFTSLQRRDGKSINLKWNGIKMKVERDVKEKVIRFAIILWRAASRYAQCQWISLIQQFLWLQMTRVTCFSSLFDVCCFVSITWNPRNRMISLSICESNRFELLRIPFRFNPSKSTSSQYILWSQWTLVHKLVGNGGHAYEFHEMTHATGALNAKKSSDQHSDLFRVARSDESCGKFRADIKRILGHWRNVCVFEWVARFIALSQLTQKPYKCVESIRRIVCKLNDDTHTHSQDNDYGKKQTGNLFMGNNYYYCCAHSKQDREGKKLRNLTRDRSTIRQREIIYCDELLLRVLLSLFFFFFLSSIHHHHHRIRWVVITLNARCSTNLH